MIFNLGRKKGGQPEYIIAGLGNPGPKYDKTRHNAGFMFLDKLAENNSVEVTKLKFHSLYGIGDVGGHNCLLMKPQTLMNNSGLAVAEAARFYKVPTERIIVVFDDISLEPGHMRIRRKGSSGGHNGINSIIGHLDSEDFPRIKIGVGKKPHPEYDLAAWVLGRFTSADEKLVNGVIEDACTAAELMVKGDTDGAMGKYNR